MIALFTIRCATNGGSSIAHITKSTPSINSNTSSGVSIFLLCASIIMSEFIFSMAFAAVSALDFPISDSVYNNCLPKLLYSTLS